MDQLDQYVGMLLDAATQQNLISASTVEKVWERHILDSLQLRDLASEGSWLDIGSGAGLPGIPIAIADSRTVALVEPRARRAAFLESVIERLSLPSRVQVSAMRIERYRGPAPQYISARAVAPLSDLFAMAHHLADAGTTWLLPKGRSVRAELADAQATWHGQFELVPSRTDPNAAIVVARNVRRKERG